MFARACAGCHGSQGQGGEHGGRPVGAINEPAFLALISDKALRRIVDHRPARSRDAGLRRHGRPAGRFPSADLGADRRPGGAAGVLEAGRAGQRPMTTSVLREGKTMDPVSNPPPSGPHSTPL